MRSFHFSIQTRNHISAFKNRDAYADLWAKLRLRFPRVWACTLMPDHLHLVLKSLNPVDTGHQLAIELRAFTRRWQPGVRLWKNVDVPQPLPNNKHIQRNIRYVHLNPCRDGFTRDPLSWEWSTHRDAMGLAYPAWTDPKELTQLWNTTPSQFASRFHDYVSADPSTHVDGTPLPLRALPGTLYSLEAVAKATRIATRSSDAWDIKTRRLIALTAFHLTGISRKDLAAALGISRQTLYNLGGTPLNALDQATLDATTRILGDSRLLGKTTLLSLMKPYPRFQRNPQLDKVSKK